jgi:hypothetical protein
MQVSRLGSDGQRFGQTAPVPCKTTVAALYNEVVVQWSILKTPELERVKYVPFDPKMTLKFPFSASTESAITRHSKQAWYHGTLSHAVVQRDLRLCPSLRLLQREILKKSKCRAVIH